MKKIFYKGFDKNLKCRDYQFEVGKEYEIDGNLKICDNGFHFCKNLKDVLDYYNIIGSRFCKIEALGKIISQKNKSCSDKIKIIKELSREEIIELLDCKNNNLGLDNLGYCNTGDRNTGDWNTGDRNTGDWNTGDRNTGDRNTGDRNTGDRNTGYRNTGDWNTGDRNTGDRNTGYSNTGDRNTGDWNTTNFETGCFNSKKSKFINIFNKKCEREIWKNTIKPNFLFDILPNIWIYL